MQISLRWTFCYPHTWEMLQRLLQVMQVPLRKQHLFYAYWAELPRFNM
jgi:hypothetical protein